MDAQNVDFRPDGYLRDKDAGAVPATRGERPGPTAIRLVRRVFFFVVFLVLIDVALGRFAPGDRFKFDDAFRLPHNREMEVLPLYADHIRQERVSNPSRRIVVFLGSSPTYGHRIKNASNTYPYAYARALSDASGPVKLGGEAAGAGARRAPVVYNLASNGQLASDQYYILRNLIDSADVFFIQLNYHTFDPKPLAETPIRYPMLPRALAQPVADDEAAVTGMTPIPETDVNSQIQRFLRTHWALYRRSDALTWSVLRTTPEQFLFDKLRTDRPRARGSKAEAEEELTAGQESTPFDELDPLQQTIIVQRYSERGRFTIRAGNSELLFVRKMAELLKSRRKKGVFFIAPINMQVVIDYELIDPEEYRRNVAFIAGPVKANGLLFLDYNRTAWLGSEHFFDISHTLDSGGRLVGRRLHTDTAGYLRGLR